MQPAGDPLLQQPVAFEGVALVAHLRDHALFLRGLVQLARFPQRIRERLLHADVLAEPDGVHRRGVMRVVGRGDGHRLDLLHLVEHLPEIAVLPRIRETWPRP